MHLAPAVSLAVAGLLIFMLPALGPGCRNTLFVVQAFQSMPGHVEPHTPGSGETEEMPAPAGAELLVGAPVQLNQVSWVRTAIGGPGLGDDHAPRAVLILIPGFLGGAKTFDPLARDLVKGFLGELEVWAVDRRPNLLEDRLGAVHAFEGSAEPGCLESPPDPSCPIFEGMQFYFADQDNGTQGDFPGGGDIDVDGDGDLDPALLLPKGDPDARGPVLFSQDDLRFLAHWGVDTYFRDWKLLVEEARAIVGDEGVVLLGGHSMGTSWSSVFAAYDFDPAPGPDHVVAGHSLIDGLVLIEGGGAGPPGDSPTDLATYLDTVAALESSGGPDVYLANFSVIDLRDLATVGEVGAIAAFVQPDEPSLAQRTPAFGGTSLITFLLGAPATNRALVGLFLDDDFSVNGAFRASMGFTDDGGNFFQEPTPPLISTQWYSASPNVGLRTWKEYDPTLPSELGAPPCDAAGASPADPTNPGCAILDNGPASDPSDPGPKTNGFEREVTPMDNFLQTQFGDGNGFEWYFASGRPFLDLSYGTDSSALRDEHLALHPGDEGPLVVTQNASMDKPVICIGGSNGLTPEPRSFSTYLGSIAPPASGDPADREIHILEGYAHLDPVSAADNEAVFPIAGFVRRLIDRKAGF